MRRSEIDVVNVRPCSTRTMGPGTSTVWMMAMTMNTAGTATSSTHRTRLRRCSRIPARSTAVMRAALLVPVGRRRVATFSDAFCDATSGAVPIGHGASEGRGVLRSAAAAEAGTRATTGTGACRGRAGRFVATRRPTAEAERPTAHAIDQPTSATGPLCPLA